MNLFHQLSEQDQKNAINYCANIVINDYLEDGVEIEAFSDEDKEMIVCLNRVITQAKKLPKDKQIGHIFSDDRAISYCMDNALDMARAAYYHTDDEFVIYQEELSKAIEEASEQTSTKEIAKPPIPQFKKKILN